MAETYDLAALVRASVDGDEDAWVELVRRHARLVLTVTRHFRLSASDAQDVVQTVWLRLVEHLAQIREPSALPGWIVTTTRHECLRQVRTMARTVAVDPVALTGRQRLDAAGVDSQLLDAERHQVLLAGLAELPAQHRELLTLLAADPPYSYTEISRTLGIPVGSIGPTRQRVLEKLRGTAAVRAYLEQGSHTTPSTAAPAGGGRHAPAGLE
jgi:RNA polymerase sigma factor (sigma-70 family)